MAVPAPVERPYDKLPREKQIVDADISDMVDLAAPEPESPDGFFEAVVDLLLSHNIGVAMADQIARQVDELADQFNAGSRERSEAVILSRLALRMQNTSIAKTAAGKGFLRVLAGTTAPTLQADADEIGCSKQAIHAAEKKMREQLFG